MKLTLKQAIDKMKELKEQGYECYFKVLNNKVLIVKEYIEV